jgi:hypothetical protein
MHGPGGSAHTAGIRQREKESKLAKGDVHRISFMNKYLKIDFT